MINEAATLNYHSFMKDLDEGRLQPTYFFYGPEDVLIERALRRLKEVALEAGSEDFNWNVFRSDADDMDWSVFGDALTSLPLLASRRVVVLKGVGRVLRNKGVTKLIESALRQPPQDLIFVMIEENPDFKKSFYKMVAETSTSVAFPFSTPQQLQEHLRNFAAEFGKEIPDATMDRMLTDTNPSLRDLLSKLEILIFYVGDKRILEPKDLEACTAFTREVDVFKLLQALGKRNEAEARLVTEQLLQRKFDAGMLISLLYRQIWAMYRMKYLQEKRIPNWKWQEQLNIKPQFLEKRYRQYLRNYTRAELGRSIEILAQADKLRKTSAVQDDYILRTLTENLLKP